MFKYVKCRVAPKWFMGLFYFLTIFYSSAGLAFDPFSIITVVGTGIDAVSTLFDSSSELAELSDAAHSFEDLYGEFNEDSSKPNDGQSVIQKLREVESLAREVGYTKEQIEDLLSTDKAGSQSLTYAVRKLTQAVRIKKKIWSAFSKLDKKAQAAQIETAQTEKEILKAQYKLLAEQQKAALEAKKEVLKKLLEQKKFQEAQQLEIKKRGGLRWGKIGIYSFPDLNTSFKEAVSIADLLRKKLLTLILMAFLFRRIQLGVSFGGSDAYGKLIIDTVLCAFWMWVTPELIKVITEQSTALAREVADSTILKGMSEASKVLEPPKVSGWTEIYNWIDWLFSNIKAVAFLVTSFIFNLGLSGLIVFLPIVIFSHYMLGFSMGLGLFMSMFVGLSLWPLFWNVIGALGLRLWNSSEIMSLGNLTSVCLSLAQFVAPVVGYRLLQGHGAMETLGKAASTITGAPAMLGALGKIISKSSAPIARGVGGATKYTASQSIQRGHAALSRMREEHGSTGATRSSVATQGFHGLVSNHAESQKKPSYEQYETKMVRDPEFNFKRSAARVIQGFKPADRIRNSRMKDGV